MARRRAFLPGILAAVLATAAGIPWPAAVAAPTVRDLAWGEVLFEQFQQRHMDALVRLAVAEHRGELAHHGAEARLLRGGLYLAWGLRDEAAALFEELLDSGAPPAQRDQAWYWLARIYFERGQPERALAALHRIGSALPMVLVPDRVDLEGRVLLALGRHAEALAVLQGQRGPGAWGDAAEFNRAIALARLGRREESEAVLDRLGRTRNRVGERALVRDRANLALGLARLEAGDDRGARTALDRVRIQSPHAARALLAAGWAEAGRGRYQAALGPWSHLASGRDPEGAWLEALLAMPWAWHQLDEAGESVAGYRRAVDTCEQELVRLADAVEMAQGDALRRVARHDAAPENGPLAAYLHALAADHPFRAIASDLEDLETLRDNLLEWRSSLEALRHMVEARRARFEAWAPAAEARLEQDELPALERRLSSLGSRVAALRQADEPRALATPGERRLLARLGQLEERIDGLPDGAERDALADRLRRLRGALDWQLNHAWPDRLHHAEREFRIAERAFIDASEQRAALAESLARSPDGFTGYDLRIEDAAQRVEQLLERVRRDHARREGELRMLVMAELEAHGERVAAYLGHARFALAVAHDQALQPRAAHGAGQAGSAGARP